MIGEFQKKLLKKYAKLFNYKPDDEAENEIGNDNSENIGESTSANIREVTFDTSQAQDEYVIRYHFIFHGRVQGVGFRYIATTIARRLDLTGWVRNIYDGTVEMEVQGKPEMISNMLSGLKKVNHIRIDYIESTRIELKSERNFKEKYDVYG